MEMKDLTPEELVKYFKDELNQDITLEEAQSMKDGGKYAKIFNTEEPDIDLLEVMKQSMKDEPFIVRVPKEIDKKLLDIVTKTTSDMALKALEDEDCNAVFIAYIKA